MIDHLRRYDTEADAIADPLVVAYRIENEWNTSCVVPGCRVYTLTGTTKDAEGNKVEVREYLPYWYLWIATTEVIPALRGKCIIIADREASKRGEAFILETLMSPEALALYQIEPVIAGSNYPFGFSVG